MMGFKGARLKFFITAVNTEVGKTFVTASLLRAFLQSGRTVIALKPVQTGCEMSGGRLVAQDVSEYAKVSADSDIAPIYAFKFPASPHYSASLECREIKTDKILKFIDAHSAQCEITLIEGAGGIFVPLNSRESFLDVMRAVDAPIVLVCKNELGAINSALCSVYVLRSHGLKIAALVLNFTDEKDEICVSNAAYLKSKLKGISVISLRKFQKDDFTAAARSFENFIASLNFNDPSQMDAGAANSNETAAVALDTAQSGQRGANLNENSKNSKARFALDTAQVCEQDGEIKSSRVAPPLMSASNTDPIDLSFDAKHLWHPYTSATHPLKARGVLRAEGNKIYTTQGALIDGMSSWWCAVQGYGSEALNAAATAQIKEFSHVMFGGLTHAPAINLGKKLLSMLPQFDRIFYADSGSVAVEVALKAAICYQQNVSPKKSKILTVRGGYHGDTFGAMSVCDPLTGMHSLFSGILARQIFAPRPSCRFDAPFDPSSTDEIFKIFKENKDEIAAIIIEPIVQGAGGMWFYHPKFLDRLRELCDEADAVLIFDEIATGFWRTGRVFAYEYCGAVPDIICIGKALSGGFMSFAAVLTNEKIAHGVSRNGGVLMHGPTFMANPLACAVSLKNLEILCAQDTAQKVAQIHSDLQEGLKECRSLDGVADVRTLGAIGVVEMKEAVDVEALQEFFVKRGVWIRPFGKNIYLMPPFITPRSDTQALCEAIRDAVKLKIYKG